MDDWHEKTPREAWTEIGWQRAADGEIYDRLWSRFDTKFEFQPSGGAPAPVILDPVPSVTFDLGLLQGGAEWAAAFALIKAQAIHAFVTALPEIEMLYVLDWQHLAYEFRPREEALDTTPRSWRDHYPSVCPDGDYYAYLTPDFEEGTFGHPWEPSLCVFGERLVGSLSNSLAAWLPVKRSVGADDLLA